VTKAKELRGMADKVITLGKEGSLHSRRQALVLVNDKKVVDKAFDELAKRFADRSGGYTRVLKLGPRKGDAAPMAIIELVK
jgi:large subunit ribosomal protein L17